MTPRRRLASILILQLFSSHGIILAMKQVLKLQAAAALALHAAQILGLLFELATA